MIYYTSYKKKKYYNIVSNIVNKNNFFFFWTLKKMSPFRKEILSNLNELNIKTIWLKKNIFSSFYLTKKNKNIFLLLKNQCFFSFTNTNNELLNVIQFINLIRINKTNLNYIGIIFKNNYLYTRSDFNLIENIIIKFNTNINQLYLYALKIYFIFFILHKKYFFFILNLINFKKNFLKIKD